MRLELCSKFIRLRVNCCVVQGIVSSWDAQKASALGESNRSKFRNFFKLFPVPKRAVFIAVCDNVESNFA